MNPNTNLNTNPINTNNNPTITSNPNQFHSINTSNFPSSQVQHTAHSIPPQTNAFTPSLNQLVAGGGVYLHSGHNETVTCALTSVQIENLQNLIRQFKTLGKRFGESCIPKLIEAHVQNTQQSGNPMDPTAVSFQPLQNQSFQPPTQPVPLHAQHLQSHQQQHQPHHHQHQSIQPIPREPAPVLSAVQTAAQSISSLNHFQSVPPLPSHQTTQPTQSSQPPGNLNQSLVTTSSQPNNALQTLSLSWQCFHSLLLYGTSKNMGENAISFPPSVSTKPFFLSPPLFVLIFFSSK
jgi:hypothetical protein